MIIELRSDPDLYLLPRAVELRSGAAAALAVPSAVELSSGTAHVVELCSNIPPSRLLHLQAFSSNTFYTSRLSTPQHLTQPSHPRAGLGTLFFYILYSTLSHSTLL